MPKKDLRLLGKIIDDNTVNSIGISTAIFQSNTYK